MSSLAFTQGFSTIIFFLAYFTWIGSEFIGAFLIPHLRRRGKTQVKRDRGSAGLIILSVFVSITVAFNLGMAGVGLLPDWIFYFGIVFMFIGVLVRQYAIAVLGKFFSLSVRVADDHRVVNTAPYRYVRHPSYTGVMLTFIGLALVVQSWVALLILLVVFALAYGYGIRVEEQTLTSQLGQAYVDYMRGSKRLLPYLV